MRVREVCQGRDDDIGILRMTFEACDRVARQHGTGKIRAPGVAAVKAAKEAAVLSPYVDSFRIGGSYFNSRDGTIIQRRRDKIPVFTVVPGSPNSIRASEERVGISGLQRDEAHPG